MVSLWRRILAFGLACWVAGAESLVANGAQPAGVVKAELVFSPGHVPFRSCHASTIVEGKHGLVAAWFGGTGEGNPDVTIWLSRQDRGHWSAPKEVANGAQAGGSPEPCWNPVLFQPKRGPLMLFYKVGPNPRQWWGEWRASADGGRTWSGARRLPAGILGPIKNKPVELEAGEILCPSSTENEGWRVHFESTRDGGKTWQTTGPVNDGKGFAAIQPAILLHGAHRLEAVGRTRQGTIFQIWSQDAGRTWSKMTALALPNPNSGIDALTLEDGRHLLVYNHTTRGRTPLNVAVSRDGLLWEAALVLENGPGEYSYPAVIQSADGLVHITYTWKRQNIRHVVLDPSKLELKPMPDGKWPK